MVGKRGIMDVILLAALVFVVAIAAVVGTHLFAEINENLQDSPIGESSYANKSWISAVEVSENFDSLVLAAFIAMIIMSLILAAVIPAHPIFIPVYVFIAILAVVISVPISNAFDEFANSATLSGTVNSYFPMADFILSNLPIIIVVLIGLMMVVTYAKGGRGFER